MAAATTLLMGWGLGHVALWLDEGASVAATQRSWPDLWTLYDSPEAPHMTYSVLLKGFVGFAAGLVPALSDHPEWLFRIPSVIASAVAGAALVEWLHRRTTPALAAASGVALLLAGGFSRFGQEARSYPMVLLLMVLATIAWWELVRPGRLRPAAALYGLAVAAALLMSPLAAPLVAVHLLASLVTVERESRWRVMLHTGAVGSVALLATAPFLMRTANNGAVRGIRILEGGSEILAHPHSMKSVAGASRNARIRCTNIAARNPSTIR